MHERKSIVMNTGPIIALVAALGPLEWLRGLYEQVLVPFEVGEEIVAGGRHGFAVDEFIQAGALVRLDAPTSISPFLLNSLDRGEASVIQLAIDRKINTVCIDEAAGRRIARLNGLSLTGSLGILLRARQEGLDISLRDAIERMRRKGVWLSARLADQVLELAGEKVVGS